MSRGLFCYLPETNKNYNALKKDASFESDTWYVTTCLLFSNSKEVYKLVMMKVEVVERVFAESKRNVIQPELISLYVAFLWFISKEQEILPPRGYVWVATINGFPYCYINIEHVKGFYLLFPEFGAPWRMALQANTKEKRFLLSMPFSSENFFFFLKKSKDIVKIWKLMEFYRRAGMSFLLSFFVVLQFPTLFTSFLLYPIFSKFFFFYFLMKAAIVRIHGCMPISQLARDSRCTQRTSGPHRNGKIGQRHTHFVQKSYYSQL